MEITEIINYSSKPQLYEKGDSVMWTDSHLQPRNGLRAQ